MGGVELGRQGQGATEYLVLLAIVIIISLIAVNILTSNSSGSGSASQTERLDLRFLDVAITSYGIKDSESVFFIQNTKPEDVILRKLLVDGYSCISNNIPRKISPGDTIEAVCTNINNSLVSGDRNYIPEIVLQWKGETSSAVYLEGNIDSFGAYQFYVFTGGEIVQVTNDGTTYVVVETDQQASIYINSCEVVVADSSGTFIWDTYNQYGTHTFTYVGESFSTTVCGVSLEIIWDGPGSQHFHIAYVEGNIRAEVANLGVSYTTGSPTSTTTTTTTGGPTTTTTGGPTTTTTNTGTAPPTTSST